MCRIISIIIFLFTTPFLGICQPITGFEKLYSTPYPNDEFCFSVHNLPDGYLVTGGVATSANDADLLLFKTDLAGNKVWETIVSDSLNDDFIANSILVDQYFYGVGYSKDLSIGKFKVLVVKGDTSGAVLWQSVIADTLNGSDANAITQNEQGGFTIAGAIIQPDSRLSGYLLNIDSVGGLVNYHIFPSDTLFNGKFHSVAKLDNGDIVTTGYKNLGLGRTKAHYVRLDTLNNILQDTIYTYFNDTQAMGYSITPLIDGNILVSNVIGSFIGRGLTVLSKKDPQGNIIWSNKITEYKNGVGQSVCCVILRDVIELPDHSLICAGNISALLTSPSPHNDKLFLLKVDSTGQELWRRYYSNDYFTHRISGHSLDTTLDNGFIIIARSEEIGTGLGDVYLIKTNCLGFSGPPNANFTTTNVGSLVTFQNLSTNTDTSIIHFGDGTNFTWLSTDTSAIDHQYSGTGPFNPYMVSYACGETDTIYATLWTGISDHYNSEGVELIISPNPASDHLNVQFKTIVNGINSIRILDKTGRVIFRSELISQENHLTIPLTTFQKGFYIIQLLNEGRMLSTRRFLKI